MGVSADSERRGRACCAWRRWIASSLVALLALAGCTLGSAPPEAARIIATTTAEAQRPTLAAPTVAPSDTPIAPSPTALSPTASSVPSIVPASATPQPTAAPSTIALSQPTATPAFPDRVISAGTIAQLRPLRQFGYGRARHAAIAPGNQLLAVATSGGVAWFELPSLKHLRFDPIEGGAAHVAFSPDGGTLAVELPLLGEQRQHTVLLRHCADGHALLQLDDVAPIFSPDGKVIAAADAGKTRLWRANDGKPIATFKGETPAFSPDGNVIATAVAAGVTLWRVADGRKLVTLRGATRPLFSLDGRLIATQHNGTTNIWRSDGTLVTQLEGGDSLFSPDSQVLVTRTESGLHLWQLPGGKALSAIAAGSPDLQLRFSADSQFLHASGWQIGVQTWSVRDGHLVSAFKEVVGDVMTLSPAGGMVSSISAGGDAPASLQLIRTDDGTRLHEDGAGSGAAMLGSEASFSFDDALAVVVTLDGLVRVIDARTGSARELPLTGYDQFAFSPDGRWLATGRGGPLVDMWRVADGTSQQLPGSDTSLAHMLNGLRFAPDGRTLFAEHEQHDWMDQPTDLEVMSWNLEASSTDAARWQMHLPDAQDARPAAPTVSWAFSPAADAVAWIAGTGQAQLLRSGTVTLTLTTPVTATALAFSSNGALLALGDDNGGVQVIDASTGTISDTLAASGSVRELSISSDSRLLGAQQADGTTLVWRIGMPEPIARLPISSDAKLLFSPDNTLVITSGPDGVSFYSLATGKLVRTWHGAVRDIAVDPAQRLLGVLRDGRVEVWGVGA